MLIFCVKCAVGLINYHCDIAVVVSRLLNELSELFGLNFVAKESQVVDESIESIVVRNI